MALNAPPSGKKIPCCVFLLIASLGATLLLAQTRIGPDEVRTSIQPYAAQEIPLQVTTNEVQVNVIVRDSHGRAIPNLKLGDFELYDEGKLQKISGFLTESSGPQPSAAPAETPAKQGEAAPPAPTAPATKPTRYIALYFDDVNTQRFDVRRLQIAAERFVNQGIFPGDRVGIFLNSAIAENVEFTDDKAKLIAAIEKIQGLARVPGTTMEECPKISAFQAYMIVDELDPGALNAAAAEFAACMRGISMDIARDTARTRAEVILAQTRDTSQNTFYGLQEAIKQLAKLPGKRILLLASDGFIAAEVEHAQDSVINQALRAGVVVDGLDTKGLLTSSPSATEGDVLAGRVPPGTFNWKTHELGFEVMATDAPMSDLALSTGGKLIFNNNDLNLGLHQLLDVPETSYVLAFSPASDTLDGKYHKLKVKLAVGERGAIQSRPGYYALTKKQAEEAMLTPQQKLDKEVSATDARADAPVNVTTREGQLASGEKVLYVDLHVDIRSLHFQQQKDRHVQQFTFVAALFDSGGNLRSGKQAEVNLALRDASYNQLLPNGLSAELTLEAPPGNYRLRDVFQEAVDGKLAAASRPVLIQ